MIGQQNMILNSSCSQENDIMYLSKVLTKTNKPHFKYSAENSTSRSQFLQHLTKTPSPCRYNVKGNIHTTVPVSISRSTRSSMDIKSITTSVDFYLPQVKQQYRSDSKLTRPKTKSRLILDAVSIGPQTYNTEKGLKELFRRTAKNKIMNHDRFNDNNKQVILQAKQNDLEEIYKMLYNHNDRYLIK